MDVGMSLWLPGGELAEYRHVKEQREMVDTVLEVGAVRYEMLEALAVVAHHHGRRRAGPPVRQEPGRGRGRGAPGQVALDVRFDAITPAVGTDGQPGGGPKSTEAAAAVGHRRQGPPGAGRPLDAAR